MTLKPDLLSLKHMCCQVFAIRFWHIQAEKKPNLFDRMVVYRDVRTHFYLDEWISSFGLPKMVEKKMHNVVIAFGDSFRVMGMLYKFDPMCTCVTGPCHHADRNRDSLFAVSHFYDSIVPSPRGGILEKETCLNLLQNPGIDSSIKYNVARHFYIHDPEVSNNVIEYCEQLARNGNCPKTFREALKAADYWAAKHYWSVMSKEGKSALSDILEEITEDLVTYNNDLGKLYPTTELLIECVSIDNRKQLLFLLYAKGGADFYDSILSAYFAYHVSPFGDTTDKLLLLLEDSLPEYVFNEVMETMLFSLIGLNKCFLYPTLVSFWERRSNEFKENFIYEMPTINDIFYSYSHGNIVYATRCLSLLQPFIPNFGNLMPPEKIALSFMSLCLWKQPLEAFDHYIKYYAIPDDKVAMKKREAMQTAVGKQIIRELIMRDNQYEDAYNILKYALATEDDVIQYISLIQAENNFAISDVSFIVPPSY